jgi:hypothetical protein
MAFKMQKQGRSAALTKQQLSTIIFQWLWEQDYNYVHSNTTSNLWVKCFSDLQLVYVGEIESAYHVVKCCRVTIATYDKYITELMEITGDSKKCYLTFCSSSLQSLIKYGAAANAACRKLYRINFLNQ